MTSDSSLGANQSMARSAFGFRQIRSAMENKKLAAVEMKIELSLIA